MISKEEALKTCDNPDRIDGRETDAPQWVRCRKCKKCLNTRHTMLAGRALAESITSDHTVALTLTYADWTGTRAQHLAYRDIQLMLKRLRFDGYQVRYLVAGEYGTKRSRAHWHCVLYFTGQSPEFPPVETHKQHWKYWADVPHRNDQGAPKPLGFVFVQRPDFHGLRYVIKYATKDEGTGKSTRKVQMSLKPPLGAVYWTHLAEREVAAGKPFRFSYRLEGARFGNGNPVEFYADGASARLKWAAFRKAWTDHNKTTAPPVHDDALAAWWRNIVPVRLRQYAAMTNRRVKLTRGPETYEKGLLRADRALLRLQSGDIVGMKYNGTGKELSLWRVAGIDEMIAVARGKRSTVARRLKFGDGCPF